MLELLERNKKYWLLSLKRQLKLKMSEDMVPAAKNDVKKALIYVGHCRFSDWTKITT